MFVYMNGTFVEAERASISPFDHGFLYGLGAFETFRTYGGQPFLLEEHLERLNAALRELQIERRFSGKEVLGITEELIKLNGLPDSYIRFNISAGPGEIGLQTDPYNSPTVIMFQKPLPAVEPLREKEAILLKLARNTPETSFRLKSHHFFNNVAAKRELGPNPGKEGVFLSEKGYLAEGITSNLFWMADGTLYTPALETGILNGITRQFVMKLAEEIHIPVKEGYFPASALHEAEEIFFTNSVQEIVPVALYDGKSLPGRQGTIVQKLYTRYQQYVPGYNSADF